MVDDKQARLRLDALAKPPGSLGILEDWAAKYVQLLLMDAA